MGATEVPVPSILFNTTRIPAIGGRGNKKHTVQAFSFHDRSTIRVTRDHRAFAGPRTAESPGASLDHTSVNRPCRDHGRIGRHNSFGRHLQRGCHPEHPHTELVEKQPSSTGDRGQGCERHIPLTIRRDRSGTESVRIPHRISRIGTGDDDPPLPRFLNDRDRFVAASSHHRSMIHRAAPDTHHERLAMYDR